MTFARALLALGLCAAGCDTAAAQSRLPDYGLAGWGAPAYAGLRDGYDVPAPIPVPAPHPVPEGFSYYLRTDIGLGTNAQKPSFSETGRTYGASGAAPYASASPFLFGGTGFSALSVSTGDTFAGGFGFGAYFTPRLRGDVTLEFRNGRDTDVTGTYSYTSSTAGNPVVQGRMYDTMRLSSTVGLVNGYFDLLPRGGFSPYVGGGVGFVYHQVDRNYVAHETAPTYPQLDVTGTSSANRAAFAAAAMAGVTFAFDHRWAIDLNYRALYLQGASATLATTGLTTTQISKATVGDNWEHQVRLGLRFNIW